MIPVRSGEEEQRKKAAGAKASECHLGVAETTFHLVLHVKALAPATQGQTKEVIMSLLEL